MIPYPLRGFFIYPFDLPAWSLFYEFIANFTYAPLLRRLGIPALLVCIAFCWAVIAVFGARKGLVLYYIGWTRPTLVLGLCRVFPTFLTGVVLYRLYVASGRKQVRGNLLVLLVMALLIAIMTFTGEVRWLWLYCIVVAGLVLPAIVFIALFAQPRGAVEKVLLILGEISFPVYVLHLPVFGFVNAYAGRYLGPYAPYSGFAYAAAIALVAIPVNRLIDVPQRRWLTSKLFKHNRPLVTPQAVLEDGAGA